MSSDDFQAGLMAFVSKKQLTANPHSALKPDEARRFGDWLRGWLSGYDATPIGERPDLLNLDDRL
jgi:hypothetical protein